jgi:hypothetical protein
MRKLWRHHLFLAGEHVLQGVLDLLYGPSRHAPGHVDTVLPHQLRALQTQQSKNPNPSAPASKTAPINHAQYEKMGGQSVGSGSAGHLVLVDVEAAELLVLPSPGDGEGARRKLAERSANHGCGDLGGMLLRSRNPKGVEDASFDLAFSPFHSIFSLVSFLAEGTKGVRRRAAGLRAGARCRLVHVVGRMVFTG